MLEFDANTHQFKYGTQPVISVTQALHGAGLIDAGHFSEWCAWRGSVVHRCCELDDHGTLDEFTVADEAWPYLLAWRAFRRESGFVPDLIEHQVFDKTWRYAGILDRTGTIGQMRLVVDLKTGAPQKWHALQLAAYCMTLDKPRLYRRFVVGLRNDGTYAAKEFTGLVDKDFAVFTAALTVANWTRSNGKH